MKLYLQVMTMKKAKPMTRKNLEAARELTEYAEARAADKTRPMGRLEAAMLRDKIAEYYN